MRLLPCSAPICCCCTVELAVVLKCLQVVLACQLTLTLTQIPLQWRDLRGHFHCLWHNTKRAAGVRSKWPAGHSFSVDGRDPWYCVDGKGSHGQCNPDSPGPYNTTLYHTAAGGGVVTTVIEGSRERPHLLFAADGSPLALVTAIAVHPKNNGRSYTDRSFTSVAPLRTAG